MGLNITAYRQLRVAENPEMEDGDVKDYHRQWIALIAHVEDNWPGRTEGLQDGTVYEWAEEKRFRAGSYSRYNSWRDWLARVAGYKSARDVWNSAPTSGPFLELINFTDCDGTIGPVVAGKLAKDFAEFRDAARVASEDPEDVWSYFGRYREWQAAFEMAADGGAVDFH